MKLNTVIFTLFITVAFVGCVPTPEYPATTTPENQVNSTREGRTFDEIIPFFKKLFGKDDEVYDYEDNAYQKYTQPSIADLIRGMLQFGSLTRKVRSLDGDTIVSLISTAEETYKNLTRARSGRTLHEAINFLKEDSKINGHIKKKFGELFDGSKADSLAVAGGIAVGITAIVLLAMLITQMKIVKAGEANARSVKIFNRWALENELEDTLPLISTVQKAIGNEGVTSRTFHEIEPFFDDVKEFFTENKLFHKFEKLYRSDAVTPAAVLGGIGAGLIGALGLGLLAANIQETSRAGHARSLQNSDDLDAAFEAFSQLADTIINKTVASTGKNGRQGRLLEEARTLNVTGLVSRFAHFKNNGYENKFDKLFELIGALAITGGLAAGAVGITALGLLIAALVKADKDFEDDDYDSFRPNINHLPARVARSTQEIHFTEDFIERLASNPCEVAKYCKKLKNDLRERQKLAGFIKGQKEANQTLEEIYNSARSNQCYKYKCI